MQRCARTTSDGGCGPLGPWALDALLALAATEALLVLAFLVWPNALGNLTTC